MDPNIQKIILEYQESMGKAGLADYLKDMNKSFKKARKSIDKHTKITKKLSKENITLAKNVFKAQKAMTTLKSAFAGMTNIFNSITVSAAAFFSTGDEFVNFAATAHKGSAALDDLRSAYGDLGDVATVSLEKAAAALAKFQSKGLAERAIAGNKQFQKSFIGLQKQLSDSVGSKLADKYMGNLMNSMNESQLVGLGKVMNTLTAGTQEWANALGLLGLGNDAQIIANALANATDEEKKLIQSQIKWNNLIDQLKTVMANAKAEIVTALGTDIKAAINSLKDDIVPALIDKIKEFVGYINDNKGSIKEAFAGIYESVKTVLGILDKLPTSMKIFAASFAFIPGANKLLGGLVWGIAKGLVSLGMSAVAAAGGFGTLTAAALPWLAIGGAVVAAGYGIYKLYKHLIKPADKPGSIGELLSEGDNADSNIKQQMKEAEQAAKEAKKLLGDMPSGDKDKPDKEVSNIIQAWNDELAEMVALSPGVSGLTSSFGSLSSIIKTFGPSAKVAGQNASEFVTTLSAMSDKSIAVGIKEAQDALVEAKKTYDDSKSDTDRAQAQERISKAMSELAKYAALQSAEINAATAADEARQRIIQSEIAIKKEDLRISQALYGTPALAVQAQQEVLKGMMEEKKNVEGQIVKLQELIKLKQGMPGMEGEVQEAQEKLNAKIKEQKSLTASQLELVKQLRDGYLDAVQAQAFGAGRFSKIIMTSEKNLMRSLEKRAAKENYLLGQFGKSASGTKAGGIAFGATPGEMTTSGGQPLSRADILAQNAARIGKMGGSGAAAAKQAQDLVMGISNDTSAIDSMLDNMIPKVAAAMGLKTGAAATTTAVGGAMKAAANTRGPSGGATITSKGSNVTGPGGGNWESKFNNWGKFLKDFGRYIDIMNFAQNEGDKSSFIKPVINQP